MEFHKKKFVRYFDKKEMFESPWKGSPNLNAISLPLSLEHTVSSFYLWYENGAFALLFAEGIWAD